VGEGLHGSEARSSRGALSQRDSYG
jgi:hypothetical protein